jgi:hypothetical protein
VGSALAAGSVWMTAVVTLHRLLFTVCGWLFNGRFMACRPLATRSVRWWCCRCRSISGRPSQRNCS